MRATRGFDGHICGHIHFGHVRELDGVLYLNDGDWVEHCTALVEDHTGAMELIHWSEQPTALGRASRELVWPSPAAALALAPLGAEPAGSQRTAPGRLSSSTLKRGESTQFTEFAKAVMNYVYACAQVAQGHGTTLPALPIVIA